MNGRIIVALDGSQLSESVLGAAKAMARCRSAELVLVRVVATVDWSNLAFSAAQQDELDIKLKHDCQAYLDSIAVSLRGEGLEVSTLVATGEPAGQLIQVAAIANADMIAMATHGRGGLQRLMVGSVADKVLHQVAIPVLLVHPPAA